jgi:hypothetical protein
LPDGIAMDTAYPGCLFHVVVTMDLCPLGVG